MIWLCWSWAISSCPFRDKLLWCCWQRLKQFRLLLCVRYKAPGALSFSLYMWCDVPVVQKDGIRVREQSKALSGTSVWITVTLFYLLLYLFVWWCCLLMSVWLVETCNVVYLIPLTGCWKLLCRNKTINLCDLLSDWGVFVDLENELCAKSPSA